MFLKTFKIYTQIFDKDVIKDYFTIFPKNLPSYFKTIPPKLFYTLIIEVVIAVVAVFGIAMYIFFSLKFDSIICVL